MKVKNTWKEGLKKITAMITLVLVIAQSLPPAVFAQEATPGPVSGTDTVISMLHAALPGNPGSSAVKGVLVFDDVLCWSYTFCMNDSSFSMR